MTYIIVNQKWRLWYEEKSDKFYYYNNYSNKTF